jgi:hypothetical protein
MRVTREILTVLADPATLEVSIVMPGLRVTLTTAEATLLTNTLSYGLERLDPQAPAAAAATEASNTGFLAPMLLDDEPDPNDRDDVPNPEPAIAGASEQAREKTRALIRTRIKDKGLFV